MLHDTCHAHARQEMVRGVRVPAHSLDVTDSYTVTLTPTCNSGWRLRQLGGAEQSGALEGGSGVRVYIYTCPKPEALRRDR